MATTYVIRTFGGTLLLVPSAPTISRVMTVQAYGRDGKTMATGRDGKAVAYGRDGKTTARGH